MSLIGPRPLIAEYLDRYTPEQARRHEVRPGITGLAQVRGGQRLAYEERFALDVWYVDHWSLWLDLKTALETVRLRVAGGNDSDPDCGYPIWSEETHRISAEGSGTA